MADSVRLDRALTERGLARSRTAAARLIEQGQVRVNGEVASRAARAIRAEDRLEVVEADPYVSRAAYKLVHALDCFGIDPAGQRALDLGASTGGFTQVLLERGAREVVALDVGHDQLDGLLRANPSVTVIEGENARYLTRERLNAVLASARHDREPLRAEDIDLVTGDLSFISLRLIIPMLAETLPNAREAVLLVKPQFEVGRAYVKGGLVTDHSVAREVTVDIVREAIEHGWYPAGFAASPIRGTHGNREYLLRVGRGQSVASEWEDQILATMKGDTA